MPRNGTRRRFWVLTEGAGPAAPVAEFESVKRALEQAGLKYSDAHLAWVPKNTLEVDGKQAEQIVHLLEDLEDLDDVQKVYSNFDIGEEQLQKLMAEA